MFHLLRRVGMKYTYSSMKMEQTECSETLAFKPQTPGNNPEESIKQNTNLCVTGDSMDSNYDHPITYTKLIFIMSAIKIH
jgi:hypothetical protein